MVRRQDRLNSSLREVISDVIRHDVENVNISPLLTVTRVDITKDLREAKVYISVIGETDIRKKTLEALNKASGFIAINASKQVRMRYFPDLKFILDDSAEKGARIEELLNEIKKDE